MICIILEILSFIILEIKVFYHTELTWSEQIWSKDSYFKRDGILSLLVVSVYVKKLNSSVMNQDDA